MGPLFDGVKMAPPFYEGGRDEGHCDRNSHDGPGVNQGTSVAGLSFLTAGVGGVLTPAAWQWRKIRGLTLLTATILGIAGLIWAVTGYSAFWAYIFDGVKYLPPGLRQYRAGI